TGDSTFIRVAFNSADYADHSVGVFINGRSVGDAPGNKIFSCEGCPGISRSWASILPVPSDIGGPLNFSLSFNASGVDANAWLNWAELFYKRSSDVGGRSIPFYLVWNNESVRYEFSNAPGGKVWDVTADETPVLKSTDLGSGRISVELQSKDDRLRKFITF